MSFLDLIPLYMLLVLLVAALLLLEEKLWQSNHNWRLSRSKLLTCTKCGNVFQLPRQKLDRHCPLCGGTAKSFKMPYSGLHEVLRQQSRNMKES